jgi:hypothetical protein
MVYKLKLLLHLKTFRTQLNVFVYSLLIFMCVIYGFSHTLSKYTWLLLYLYHSPPFFLVYVWAIRLCSS